MAVGTVSELQVAGRRATTMTPNTGHLTMATNEWKASAGVVETRSGCVTPTLRGVASRATLAQPSLVRILVTVATAGVSDTGVAKRTDSTVDPLSQVVAPCARYLLMAPCEGEISD
jgi:hypothetical protein